jgi:transcription initiation factor TFIID subunit TAF12
VTTASKTTENLSSLMTNSVRSSNSQQQQSQQQEQPQQQTQQRRYYQCNKGYGQEIYFDANNKSQSGKWIPLSKDTGLLHQCQ